MTNLIIREWLNGGLIPLNICIMAMIGYQIHIAQKSNNLAGTKPATALWWIFGADLIRAGLAWYTLHLQNSGRVFPYLGPTATFLYSIAAVIAISATLRLIYVLSPESWGHKGWIAATIFCSISLLALQLVR